MIRLDESFRELFEANDRRTNITNMLPQYGGIHFPRRSGLAVGGDLNKIMSFLEMGEWKVDV